ncbi:MAG: DNA repair protein RecO [Polyangia bacterium]
MARTLDGELALVLRAVAYGEADRVVVLLCQNEGKVAALAKGARRSQKRFAGGLGLMSLGRATYVERPGADLARLERFEATAMWPGVLADLGKIAHVGYVAELLDILAPAHQQETPLFELALAFLTALDAGEASADRLRVFELQLLDRLGMRPELARCVVCARPSDDRVGQRLDPVRGGIACGTCRAEGPLVGGEVRIALVAAQARTVADDATSCTPEVARGMREALRAILAVHLPRQLKSVGFIDKLNRASS